MNKKLILVPVGAVVLAATTGGVAAVSQHYQKYQNKQAVAQAAEAKKKADAATAKEVYTKKLEAAYTTQRLECEKGLAAYDKLSAFLQKTTSRPQCQPAVIH